MTGRSGVAEYRLYMREGFTLEVTVDMEVLQKGGELEALLNAAYEYSATVSRVERKLPWRRWEHDVHFLVPDRRDITIVDEADPSAFDPPRTWP